MANAPLRIVAVDPKLHQEAVLDLICKTFENYSNFMRTCRDSYYLNSFVDPAASRIGFVGATLVTHFGVWDYQTRVGRARLRTGGIGAVATLADYRKRGYMDQTARAGVAAMRDQGYDISTLFGVWNFYNRFGYTRAWAGHEITVNMNQLPEAKLAVKVSKIPYAPRPELDDLYNRFHATDTGTAVRPTYSRPRHADVPAYGWRDGKGKLQGYFAYYDRAPRMDIIDSVGEPEQVLRAIAQVGRKTGRTEARFGSLPAGGAIATLLRRGTCRESFEWVRAGSAMVRIINLQSTFEKLSGELSQRLAASPMGGFTGDLTLYYHKEHVTLGLKKGKVSVRPAGTKPAKHAVLARDELAQLVLGTQPPEVIVESFKPRLTGDAKLLLPALFPDQQPMLEGPDHF